MRRLILLVVASDMYGLSQVSLQIAKRLTGEFQVELWSPADGPLLEHARSLGVRTRVVPLPVLRRSEVLSARLPITVLLLLLASARLWFLVRKERRDMAVVHALGAPSLGGLVVSRAARCPFVWSVHEVFSSSVETRLFRVLLRGADVRIACSQFVAQQFGRGSGAFRVIHSGTDVAESGSPPCQGPETVLICVGRLNRWKGQDTLMRAYAALPEDVRSRTKLQLVGGVFEGDPGVQDDLLALRSVLGVEDSVDLLGERLDARALMAEADIVVVPSQKPEPFGMVVIEGMALGRPVVATTPGGPAEVVTDGVDGLLVSIGDSPGLTAALMRLLDSPVEARLIGERAQLTARKFTGTAAADAYRSAYLEVLT